MKFKYYYISILFFILAIFIFLGDVGSRYVYYKNLIWFHYFGISNQSTRYPKFSLEDFINTTTYINNVPVLETVSSSKRDSILNNSKIGEALGFLTESVKSQKDLIHRFPFGIFSMNSIISDLKSKKILAPYGNYNNNYLSNQDTLIYSDDVELANLTYQTLAEMNNEDLSKPIVFVNNLTLKMKDHWLKMKKSGNYGEDGLSHGKRGYSKNILSVLSELSTNLSLQNEWNNKWPNRMGNNSLSRAFIIGLDIRLTREEAFDIGEFQSYITHSDNDISIASGVIASLFNKMMKEDNLKKKEVIQYLYDEIKTKASVNSLALKSVEIGRNLANRSLNPILVYNFISGFNYNEFLTLLVYSFLYFDKFEDALTNIIHTTGDNESLAFMLGALFGAYNKMSLLPEYLNYIEAKDVELMK